MNWLDAVIYHGKKYSQMQPADVVKLVYQSEFGGEYIEQNLKQSLQRLKQEMKNVVPDDSVGMFEPVGNGFMRVNLAALPSNDISVYTLDSLYILSTKLYSGDVRSLIGKLDTLRDIQCNQNILPVSADELSKFIDKYIFEGCCRIPHSDEFKAAYHPAYRVVHKELLRLYVFDA